jgi:shikimate dehydrogenase
MSGTRFYGLIGYPVKHSFSPSMHNAAFRALGIDAEYGLFELKPNQIAAFFSSLTEKHIYGFNVTVPYKEQVFDFLNNLSHGARFTGAVNVVTRDEDGTLTGWNTDGLGFHYHLTRELGFNLEGKKVVLLGAGGAAKAVADQLANGGALKIEIYDIEQDKSEKLTEKINKHYQQERGVNAVTVSEIDDLQIEAADLLINATPVGLKPTDSCLVPQKRLHSNLLVYDLIYNPHHTPLLKAAKDKGAKVSNGLGMLFWQGCLSFSKWLNRIPGHENDKIPEAEMRQALARQIKAKKTN